jgi:hypothetical protein
VQQRGTAADCHHQGGCGTADLGSLAPGSINVVAVQRNAPQPAQRYEAKRPWPGQEIQRKRHLFGIRFEREAEGNSNVAAMNQDIGEAVPAAIVLGDRLVSYRSIGVLTNGSSLQEIHHPRISSFARFRPIQP